MLERKEISSFIWYKFVQVNQAVEEYADSTADVLYFFEFEVTLETRLNQIIHLAKQIHKQYRLVIQILKSVHLLFVEVLHFMRGNYLVVVQVNNLKPVCDAPQRSLIFLAEHKPHKVFVVHFVFGGAFKLPWYLFEYAVHCLAWKGMSFVPWKVFLVDEEVVISI